MVLVAVLVLDDTAEARFALACALPMHSGTDVATLLATTHWLVAAVADDVRCFCHWLILL